MYRYISRESCSQFDSIPLTSLTTADHAHCAWHCAGRSDHVDAATDVAAAAELGRCGDRGALPRVSPRCLATAPPRTRFTGPCSHPARTTAVLSRSLALSLSRSSYRPAPGNAASCLSPTPGPRGAERDIASAHRRGGNPVGAHGGGASNAAEAALARHSARRPLRLSSHRARAFPLLPRGRHDGRR